MAFNDSDFHENEPPLLNMRVLRVLRRISQDELAKRAGLKQDYVSCIERGMRPSRRTHVERIAKVLGVPVALLREPNLLNTDLTRSAERSDAVPQNDSGKPL